MIKHIYSENLFKNILKSYDNKDDYFIRFYSFHCLRILTEAQIKQFEDKILEIMFIEKDETILMVGMPVIIKMDEAKAFPFFVESFKNGTKGLRSICYVYLKKMSNKFYEKVRKQLEKENAADALSLIEDAELGRKPR